MTERTIKVVEYSEAEKNAIKTLNYEWLENYFRVEESDVLSLNNPKEEIIDKGGFIFYAKIGGQILGTISLLRKTDHLYEIGKMAVSSKAQNQNIGTYLLEHFLQVAKERKIGTLILYSNTKLEAAIYLYRKYGFREIPLEEGLYERANIKMQKDLD